MKRYIIYICLGMLPVSVQAQGIRVMPGTTFKQSGPVAYIVMADNAAFENNEAIASDGLILKATGNGNTEIKGSAALNVAGLHVSKTTGQAVLQKNISVDSIVDFSGGLLDLNTHQLLLGAAAKLQNESEASRITGSLGGSVEITQDLNAPLAANPGNIGIAITSGANMGTTTIRRSHKIVSTPFGGTNIERTFDILPATNTGLAAQLRAFYFDAEANGLDENKYDFYRTDDGGNTWQNVGSSGRDAAQNFVNISNVATMSRFTLSTSDNKLSTGNISSSQTVFTLLQNPVQQTLYLGIQSPAHAQYNMHIYDVQGKELVTRQLDVSAGNKRYITDVSTLPPGSYMVNITGFDGRIWKTQFVKF